VQTIKYIPLRIQSEENEPWLHSNFGIAMEIFDFVLQVVLPAFATNWKLLPF